MYTLCVSIKAGLCTINEKFATIYLTEETWHFNKALQTKFVGAILFFLCASFHIQLSNLFPGNYILCSMSRSSKTPANNMPF